MHRLSRLNLDATKLLQLHDDATSLSAPSGGSAGAALSTWLEGQFAPSIAVLKIVSAGTVNLTDFWLDVYDGTNWYQAILLNQGRTIPLLVGKHYTERVLDIGMWSRVACHGTFSASIAIDIFLQPVDLLDSGH